MEPLGHGVIRFRHLGDRRKHGAFLFRLVLVRARFRLQLFGAISHRGFFLVRPSRGLLFARGSALGGLLHVLLQVHRNLLNFIHRFAIHLDLRLLSRLRRLVGRFNTELLGILRRIQAPIGVEGAHSRRCAGSVSACQTFPASGAAL
jgi:hypothetical protein